MNPPENRGAFLAAKRVLDIVFSVLALVVMFVPMLLIALIIYLDDPRGSPIFSQLRCGKDGKPFRFHKFRTMVVDAERQLKQLYKKNEMSGPAFKIRNDPRITRVGGFLRRTGLDELPQFFNVLRGDMSLVGPRPPLMSEYSRYDEYQRQRVSIKPGITCYWQVTPGRNSLDFDRWMELDLLYIRERSVMVDLGILVKTVYVMCTAQGE